MNLYFIYTFLVLFCCNILYCTEESVITLNQGKIKGSIEKSSNGRDYYSFRTIPYAIAPVKNLRFKDPVPAEKWNGERNGSLPTPICIQPQIISLTIKKTFLLAGSEDCLYMNVYSPKIDASANLPVIVYFHGGEWISGAADRIDAKNFMNEDVVFVTFNYRLGIFGFASTEDEVVSGNFGLKDQLLALRWIQENIKDFGGNPKQVTAFGENVGAAAIHHHIVSGHGKGLFNRAILHSGSVFSGFSYSQGHRDNFIELAALFDCKVPAGLPAYRNKVLASCLKEVEERNMTDSLHNFLHFISSPHSFAPRIDGNIVKKDPLDLIGQIQTADFDIMHGYNSENGGFFVLAFDDDIAEELYKTDQDYIKMITMYTSYMQKPLKFAKEAYKQYNIKESISLRRQPEAHEKLITDRLVLGHELTSMAYADIMEKSNKNMFYYEYSYAAQRTIKEFFYKSYAKDWTIKMDELLMLAEIDELGMKVPRRSQQDEKVSNYLIKMWTNFAKQGNPTPDAFLGFKWTPFTKKSPKHLKIDAEPFMESDYRKEMRDFWIDLLQLDQWKSYESYHTEL